MQELLVGDPAPELVLGEFLKGEPEFELVSGNIYVIEFWASWCGPCRACIPLLSELQDELPQVTVIGVSIERDTAAVRTFVAEMGDQIRYRIAMDQSPPNSADETEGWMVRHWLHASYKSGVPTSFVVDASGKIAWLGHLMELKATLMKIVNGDWDLAAAAQAHKESFSKDRVRFHFQPKILKAYSDNDNATAVAEIDKAIAAEPALEEVFCTLKLRALMKDPELMAAAKNYATQLIDLHQEDMQSLLMLSMMLFEPNKMEAQGGGFERNAVFLDLAVQAMNRIETLLRQDPSSTSMMPHVRMQYEEHFAGALVAAGSAGEAFDHAQHAYHWGKKAGVSGDVLAKLEILKTQCQGSQSFGTMTNPAFD